MIDHNPHLGGRITLLDRDGRVVDQVRYTRNQTRRQGWTITF
ncbi:MAG: hypothetical protein AAGD38_16940 [Acidobacteriota bacterium]